MCEYIPSCIRNSFLLRSVDEEHLDKAYQILSPLTKTVDKGHVFVTIGGVAPPLLYFLQDGKIGVYRNTDHKTIINTIEAGGSFGAASLFSNASAVSQTEIVAENRSTVLIVAEDVIRSFFLQYPTSALDYISFLTDRIAFLNRRVRDFSADSAEKKTARLLLSHADSETGIVDIPNLRKAADSMRLGRASLYRVLSSFSEKFMIRKDGKQIKITDIEQLKGILK